MRDGIRILKEPTSRLLQKKRGTTRVAPRKSTPKEEGGGDNWVDTQRASTQQFQFIAIPFKLQGIYCAAKQFTRPPHGVNYFQFVCKFFALH